MWALKPSPSAPALRDEAPELPDMTPQDSASAKLAKRFLTSQVFNVVGGGGLIQCKEKCS